MKKIFIIKREKEDALMWLDINDIIILKIELKIELYYQFIVILLMIHFSFTNYHFRTLVFLILVSLIQFFS
jgi:hypothetical protein